MVSVPEPPVFLCGGDAQIDGNRARSIAVFHGIPIAATVDEVIAGTRRKTIAAAATEQAVVATLASQIVVTVAAFQRVVAETAIEEVVAVQALQQVGRVGALQPVVACRAVIAGGETLPSIGKLQELDIGQRVGTHVTIGGIDVGDGPAADGLRQREACAVAIERRRVDAGTAVDSVRRPLALQVVIAASPNKGVVAGIARQLVVGLIAGEVIRKIIATQIFEIAEDIDAIRTGVLRAH